MTDEQRIKMLFELMTDRPDLEAEVIALINAILWGPK